MLIVLSSDLEKYSHDNDVPKDVMASLRNLAIGFSEGQHIIAGSVKTMTALQAVKGLEANTQAVFARIKERFSQLMALPEQYKTYVRVLHHTYGEPERKILGKQSVIEVPIHYFSRTARIQETILLAENSVDAEIAVWMAEYYKHCNHFPSVPICSDKRNGGGSNLASTFQSIKDAKERFCVALVDSDMPCPSGALGDTARSVKAVFSKNPVSPLVELLILNCRAMENALPDSIYEEAYGNEEYHREAIDFLKQLGGIEDDTVREFVNIKKGLSGKDILSMKPNSPEKGYWHSRISVLSAISKIEKKPADKCFKLGACQHENKCRCLFLRANSSDILDSACKIVSKWSPQRFETVDERASKHWNQVGRLVFEWCCGWQFSVT